MSASQRILVVLNTARGGQNDRLEAYPRLLSGASRSRSPRALTTASKKVSAILLGIATFHM
jgi:hypothetical protein